MDQNTGKAFWTWFEENNHRFFDSQDDIDAMMTFFEDLKSRLNSIHEELVFEFAVPVVLTEESPVELTISANGSLELFDYVHQLVDMAPTVPFWKFRKFKQPKEIAPEFQLGEMKISSEDIFFSLQKEENKIAINVYTELFDESVMMELYQIVFLFLDSILGEVEVATSVGNVDIHPLTDATVNIKKFSSLREEYYKMRKNSGLIN